MLFREDRNGITILRLQHGKAHALDIELTTALNAVLADLSGDDGARAVVLIGSGSIFCAGVDLFRIVREGDEYIERFLPLLATTFTRLFAFPGPVVAAVNGHAIAGGCVLACACDYRLMARGAGTIGVPELRVGVPFPLVAIEILRFAVTSGHLQELVYGGKTFGAAEACEKGLVDEMVDPANLLGRAYAVAEHLASEPVARFRITKRQLRRPTLERIERQADETVADVLRAWKDPATLRAIKAYVDETIRRRGPPPD